MLKSWVLSLSLLLSSIGLAKGETVEFLINSISRTSEWGHVSLRVKGPDTDKIYDFGRYGFMWFFNGEGDPVLRVWDNSFDKYIKYRTQGDRIMTRYVFQSTEEKNAKILEHFDQLLSRGKRYTGREGRWASKSGNTKDLRNYKTDGAVNYFVPGLGEFHATDNNCATVSVDAFEKAFDLKIHGLSEYIQGRGFQKGIAYYGFNAFTKGIVGSQFLHKTEENRSRGRVFWPADLAVLLNEKSNDWSEIIAIEEYRKFNQPPKVLK